MGRRPGRAAAKNANAALKNTPQTYDEAEDIDEDEQMADVATSEVGSPAAAADEDDEADEDEEGSAHDSEASGPASPLPEPVRRGRRLGRPPKNRPADWDTAEDGSNREGGTPAKRGRGRGGFGRGGGRWARRGGPSHVTQQPVDKEGNMMDVINDEVELPEDPEGEAKVGKLGHLNGGRDYRCRTFTVLGRGERLYMLSTEPARCVGFRDSYLFFTKHKRLFKIIIDDDEKRDLIDRELIPHSYKGRAIGICTARSVFREFGAQIIVGGRRIIDDYEVAKARADGVMEGEIADPNDHIKPGETYNKNQYVAWHGASSVYHSGAPTVPLPQGKAVVDKKRRVMINDVNWMLEHAREASRFNATLTVRRRVTKRGVYNIHTNSMHYPKSMQPTHARWEQIDDHAAATAEAEAKFASMDLGPDEAEAAPTTIFTPVNPIYSAQYRIVDIAYETPASSHFGVPGPDGPITDLGFNGLSAVSDEIKDLLPPECRLAFDSALERENEWKGKWRGETQDGGRKDPRIQKGFFI